jgi:hypothetical protein
MVTYFENKSAFYLFAIYLMSLSRKLNVLRALIETSRQEEVWGSGGTTPSFLTSSLDGGEWSASHPDHFTAEKNRSHYLLDKKFGRSPELVWTLL